MIPLKLLSMIAQHRYWFINGFSSTFMLLTDAAAFCIILVHNCHFVRPWSAQ